MNRPPTTLRRRRTAAILFGIALGNFLLFTAVDFAIFNSGRPLDRDERYLSYVLIQKGSYHQVSPTLYVVDRVYAYATMAFLLVGMAAGVHSGVERATRPLKSSGMCGAV